MASTAQITGSGATNATKLLRKDSIDGKQYRMDKDLFQYLERVAAHPHDDDLRRRIPASTAESESALVEFVNVQCDVYSMLHDHENRSPSRMQECQKRSKVQDQLLADNRQRWNKLFECDLAKNVVYQKGLPHHLVLDVGDDASREQLLRKVPTATGLTLLADHNIDDIPRLIALVADAVSSSHIDNIVLTGRGWSDSEVRQFASLPAVSKLKSLCLRSCDIGDSAVQTIATSPHLKSLEQLELSGTTLLDGGVAALANLRGTSPKLRTLCLSDAGLMDDDVPILAKLVVNHRLDELDISFNSITPEALEAFLSSKEMCRTPVVFSTEGLPDWVREKLDPVLDAHNRSAAKYATSIRQVRT